MVDFYDMREEEISYVEVSCKENVNVEEAFMLLARSVLAMAETGQMLYRHIPYGAKADTDTSLNPHCQTRKIRISEDNVTNSRRQKGKPHNQEARSSDIKQQRQSISPVMRQTSPTDSDRFAQQKLEQCAKQTQEPGNGAKIR